MLPRHTGVRSIEPADGAVLDRGPSQLVLTFDENVNPTFVQVSLTSGDVVLTTSAPTVSGPVVRVTLAPPGPGGYRIAFRVVSADGHPVSGESSFRVAGATASTGPATAGSPASSTAKAGSPGPSSGAAPSIDARAAQPTAGGSSALPWLVGGGALLVLAAGAGVVAARRR